MNVPIWKSNFGKNLEQLMIANGLSQVDLANRAGLTPAAVSQLLSGQRNPALSTIMKILSDFPVTFERLIK